MPNEAASPETPSGRAWSFLMSWTGRVTAIVGLCATIAGGVTWLISHHRQQREQAAELTLAQTQAAQGDYPAAVDTYSALLNADSLDRTALDGQLDMAMLWAENFSVLVPDGQSATQAAGGELDKMISILESGLARSKGTRAADVQAHLGWAHWLNQHIAEREFGPAAEQNFRAALATDPANVYANAMLGNWMLQNGGSFSEAVQHFHTAASGPKTLPVVRRLQVGGFTSYDHPGSRGELIKAANAMRLDGEALDPDARRRVFGFCCDVGVTDRAELVESLSAVPAQDALKTYEWLEDSGSGASSSASQALIHDYVQANLLEISGQQLDALRQFRGLQQKLRSEPNSVLQDPVNAAVARLAHT